MSLKPYFKSITKKEWFQRLASWLLATYMKIVYKTVRWEYVNSSRLENYTSNKRPLIICFWHNRLGMMRFAWTTDDPFHMLSSGHSDGKIIAGAMKNLGLNTIEGSSSKSSTAATRNLLKVLKTGGYVGVTPDGPRGPRYSVKPGLIQIAQVASVDLMPISYSITNRVILNSWDGLAFPLPFGKGVIIYGEPISAHRSENTQELAELLRKRLIETSDQSDILTGNVIIPEKDSKARA